MNFSDANDQIRLRLAESGSLLSNIRALDGGGIEPASDFEKQLRAYLLVSIYATLEKGLNLCVEATLHDISRKAHPTNLIIPSLSGVIHYPKIKSLKDCKMALVLDHSAELFDAATSRRPAQILENPFGLTLQNVDGGTIEWVLKLFGIQSVRLDTSSKVRLGTLRERRNAVSHGRESAVEVGERYNLPELQKIYDVVDFEIARLSLTLKNHCESNSYLRVAA